MAIVSAALRIVDVIVHIVVEDDARSLGDLGLQSGILGREGNQTTTAKMRRGENDNDRGDVLTLLRKRRRRRRAFL